MRQPPCSEGLVLRDASQPRRALRDSVLYELNVRGFTMGLPGLPDALRGTFRRAGAPTGYRAPETFGRDHSFR